MSSFNETSRTVSETAMWMCSAGDAIAGSKCYEITSESNSLYPGLGRVKTNACVCCTNNCNNAAHLQTCLQPEEICKDNPTAPCSV